MTGRGTAAGGSLARSSGRCRRLAGLVLMQQAVDLRLLAGERAQRRRIADPLAPVGVGVDGVVPVLQRIDADIDAEIGGDRSADQKRGKRDSTHGPSSSLVRTSLRRATRWRRSSG